MSQTWDAHKSETMVLGVPNGASVRKTHVEYQVRCFVSLYCPPAVVPESDVQAKASKERGADRADFPEPAEEYGPGGGGEECYETR